MNAFAVTQAKTTGGRSIHQFDYIAEMMQIALIKPFCMEAKWRSVPEQLAIGVSFS